MDGLAGVGFISTSPSPVTLQMGLGLSSTSPDQRNVSNIKKLPMACSSYFCFLIEGSVSKSDKDGLLSHTHELPHT